MSVCVKMRLSEYEEYMARSNLKGNDSPKVRLRMTAERRSKNAEVRSRDAILSARTTTTFERMKGCMNTVEKNYYYDLI